MLVWGWGQLATGDRHGWLLVAAQPIAIAMLAWLGPAFANGPGVSIAFTGGVALLAVWAAVALHAYRRAARRRLLVELPGPDGGAIWLLVLAPVAIAASSLFWGLAGREADPAAVLDRYVADWRAGRAAEAITRFAVTPGSTSLVHELWDAQLSALRNELVRLVPRAGPGGGVDPDAPFETVRWVDAGATPAGGRLVALEVARRETVHGLLLGLLPVSSQRLVPLERLGTVELAPIPAGAPFAPAGPIPDGPWATSWRIIAVEILDVRLGG